MFGASHKYALPSASGAAAAAKTAGAAGTLPLFVYAVPCYTGAPFHSYTPDIWPLSARRIFTRTPWGGMASFVIALEDVVLTHY